MDQNGWNIEKVLSDHLILVKVSRKTSRFHLLNITDVVKEIFYTYL